MGNGTKKTIITALIIFVTVLIITFGVLYVSSSASDDVNDYLCKLQTSWGVPSEQHFHFSFIGKDKAGTKYVCKY